MAAAASCVRRMFGAVRTFKGFTQRPDPFEPLYRKGQDKTALKELGASKEMSLISRLSKFSNGRLGPAVDVMSSTGERVELVQRRKDSPLLPRYKLVDELTAQEIISNTDAALQLEKVRPEPRTLPEASTLRKEPDAGSKRFTFAFVDSSAGHNYETRPVLLREPDGTLRTANPVERDRFLLAVYPDGNKKLKLPAKFDEANLPTLLGDNMHAEVLDEVCDMRYSHQLDYIRVHRSTYEDIEARQIYSVLQDTVHWRDFLLFLIRENRYESLLLLLVDAKREKDALDLLMFAHEHNNKPAPASLEEFAHKTKSKRLIDALERLRRTRLDSPTSATQQWRQPSPTPRRSRTGA